MANDPTHAKIVHYLNNYLKLTKPPDLFKRSTWGATGVTFLPVNEFPLVLKWQSRLEAEAEYVCTQFFSRAFSSLSIPTTILADDVITNCMIKYVQKQKVEGVAITKQIPLLIEYKHGSNFKEVCKYWEQSMTVDKIISVCSTLGEIAGYDFLIGNTDRLIPLNLNDFANHKANGGNLQLELDDEGNFRSCHVIDIAPYFNAFFSHQEKKQASPSEGEEVAFSLFGDEPDEEEDREVKQNETTNSKTGEALRQHMASAFTVFLEAKNWDLIATAIAVGLKNECKHMAPDRAAEIDRLFAQHQPLVKQGLVQGLARARENMRGPKCSNMLAELARERKFAPTTEILLRFIAQNLDAAR